MDDAGAVTVEAALALGTLVAVTAAAVGAVAAVAAGVRCTDAARELARQAARGDTDRGRVAAAQLAPAGAEPELRLDEDLVVVTVRVRPVGLLPVTISGTATAAVEPGVTAGVTQPVASVGVAQHGSTAGLTQPVASAGVTQHGVATGVAQPGVAAGTARYDGATGSGRLGGTP